ncbi:MAG: hypothetical protein LBJ36_00890 [Synergistaceae bacterium]|nr:hypothetical protein [Synergistaceae bacterium]
MLPDAINALKRAIKIGHLQMIFTKEEMIQEETIKKEEMIKKTKEGTIREEMIKEEMIKKEMKEGTIREETVTIKEETVKKFTGMLQGRG